MDLTTIVLKSLSLKTRKKFLSDISDDIWIIYYFNGEDDPCVKSQLTRVLAPNREEAFIKYFRNLDIKFLKYELPLDDYLTEEDNDCSFIPDKKLQEIQISLSNERILEILTQEEIKEHLEIFKWNELPLFP